MANDLEHMTDPSSHDHAPILAPDIEALNAADSRSVVIAGARSRVRPEDEAEAPDEQEEHGGALTWPEALRILVVALAAAVVGLHVWTLFTSSSAAGHVIGGIIGVVGLVVGGWPIYREALENIAARRMTMELSMTIAILAAAAIGQFFTECAAGSPRLLSGG